MSQNRDFFESIYIGHSFQKKTLGFINQIPLTWWKTYTGSRVLAFTFKRDIFDGNQLKLEDELWKQNKPGLSSFAQEPAKVSTLFTLS